MDDQFAVGERRFDAAHLCQRAKALPQRLGQERHERVQQPQRLVEHERERLLRDRALVGVGLGAEARLDQFQIPIAQFAPEELARRRDRGGGVVVRQRAMHRCARLRQARQDPAILERQVRRLARHEGRALEVQEREARRIEQLVAEVGADSEAIARRLRWREPFLCILADEVHRLLRHRIEERAEVGARLRRREIDQTLGFAFLRERRDRLHGQANVLRAGLQLAHDVAQRVGAVARDDVERVDAVALALRHALALAVEDRRVQEHRRERHVAEVVEPRDHHARDPQRDDVAAGHEAAARVPVVERVLVPVLAAQRSLARVDLRGIGVRPTQRAVRPQRRTEPRVEHVGIEFEPSALQHRARRRIGAFVAEADLRFDGLRSICLLQARDRVGDRQARAIGQHDPRGDVVARELALQHRREHQQMLRRQFAAPHRDAMAPPELTADAPVALLREPLVIHLAVAVLVRVEHDLRALRAIGERGQRARRRVERRLREALALELLARAAAHHDAAVDIGHAHEPLLAEPRLDDRLAAVAVVDLDRAVFDLLDEPLRVEVRHDALARGEAIEALIGALRCDRAVAVQHVDCADLAVALPHFVVVGVVRRRDLDAAGAERRIGPFVGDQRDLAARQRQRDLAALLGERCDLREVGDQLLLALQQALEFLLPGFAFLVRSCGDLLALRCDRGLHRGRGIWVHGDCRVAEHRLGSRRRDEHVLGFARGCIRERIAQVMELALHRLFVELVIGDGGLQRAVPVDESIAAEDQAIAEHREERLPHRARTHGVHRESRAVPIARAAHALLLRDDALLALLLPIPDALHQSLAADVVARLAFDLLQPLLDDRLRRDAGVVGARLPQRVVALHAMPTDQEVLHHVVHRVPHVQRAGHVRQRHHHDVAFATRVGEGGEGFLAEPRRGDRGLEGLGFVLGWQLGRHRGRRV